MNTITAKGSVDNWIAQLREFFHTMETMAQSGGWIGDYNTIETGEDPFSLGASLPYEAPVLNLKRLDPKSGAEQRVTFEPQHRFTVGAAGRIDVFSYPRLREAMLLRIPDKTGTENLTWDEAEERVANAPWKAFSQERMPLSVDLADGHSVLTFLEDLVA